jgi:hypothetical protein
MTENFQETQCLQVNILKHVNIPLFVAWENPTSVRSIGIMYTYTRTCHVCVTYKSRLAVRLISFHESFPVRSTTVDSAAFPVTNGYTNHQQFASSSSHFLHSLFPLSPTPNLSLVCNLLFVLHKGISFVGAASVAQLLLYIAYKTSHSGLCFK